MPRNKYLPNKRLRSTDELSLWMKTRRVVIGIDGGKKTGLAVWSKSDGAWCGIITTDFWGAVDVLNYALIELDVAIAHVRIEAPSGNAPVFPKRLRGIAKSCSKKVAMKKAAKIGQRVGSVQRESDLLIEWCRIRGVKHSAVTPTEEKWDHKTFCKMFGYPHQTNEHERDAGKLAYDL